MQQNRSKPRPQSNNSPDNPFVKRKFAIRAIKPVVLAKCHWLGKKMVAQNDDCTDYSIPKHKSWSSWVVKL